MALDNVILRYILDHKGFQRQKILKLCGNPPTSVDKIIGRLKENGLIYSSNRRPVTYFLTKRGEEFLLRRSIVKKTQEITLSEKEIIDRKEEIMASFEREIENQIIVDKDLLDTFTTLPFCRGRIGRNNLGLLSQFIGSCGRGKGMLHAVYNNVMNSKKIDCRDYFPNEKRNLKELENIVSGQHQPLPDILFVDEIGMLYNSPRHAYQKYLDDKEFPIILMGNPSTDKINIKDCNSFEDIVKHESKSGRSIMDRVHLWVYWPPLTLEEKKLLPKIIFNKHKEDLGAICSYIQYVFENYDPKWTDEAQECFNLMLENAEKLLNGERKSYYMGKRGNDRPDHYVVEPKRSNSSEKYINLHNHIEGPRFTISIISISRAIAMKDLRNEVQRSDVLKALEIKFNFLKKLYRNTSLIEDLTRGIERKGEKEIVARVRA